MSTARWVRPALLGAALALASGPAGAQSARTGALVIRGGTLIDGTGRPAVPGAVVVVREGRIACAGPAAECPVEAGAHELDVKGRFLAPGLIDGHVHLHWTTDSAGTRQVEELRFSHGITTVREAGTNRQLEANLTRRARAAEARRAVPRLFVSAVLAPGGAAGVDDAPAQVRRLAALGVNAIKVKDPLPAAELEAAAAVARELGLPVYGHVWVGEAPAYHQPVAPGAYDGVSHLQSIAPAAIRDQATLPPLPDSAGGLDARRRWIKSLWLLADDELLTARIRALVERGAWLEPLLIAEEQFVSQHRPARGEAAFGAFPSVRRRLNEIRLPERSAEDRRRLIEAIRRSRAFVLGFHRAGGMLVAGTDNAPIPGIALHHELQALVSTGLTPAEALATATRNAAAALRASDSLGTIEPGKLADLLVLDGDPLADIRNTRRIWRVVKAGVVHTPEVTLASLRREARAYGGSGWSRRRLVLAVLLAAALGAGALALVRRGARLRPR